ncbi:E3 ubiquitin-protein ligase RNF169-like [Venturia canescens]|uniref:E3 ubiquitin-protein ligase RNF169-like n=1 Tax=Venturia canescens TaxID=32260 RepID=UPI001C9C2407|nr:E3 ubiquitin-protein ligase RNF169-like [Venturia canescens]
MATYLKRTSKLYDLSLIGSAEGDVNLRDLMCPICRGILIEPVTLPCTHNLCLRCLKGTFEHNSLSCPLCRVRVGSWLRTATKSETLVNSALWQLIRSRFPKEVEGKHNGVEQDIQLHSGFASKKIILSAAGEIRREYEAQLQAAEEEMRREREAERLANEALIRKIQAEEEADKLSQLASDRLLAKTFAKKQLLNKNKSVGKLYEAKDSGNLDLSVNKSEQLNSVKNSSSERMERISQNLAQNLVTRNVTNQPVNKYSNLIAEPGCSGTQIFGSRTKEELHVPIDILSSKKKILDVEVCLNKNDNDERIGSAESAGSHDSINQEIHHFKPIKPIPRTSLKMSPDGRPIDPKLIKVVPILKRVSNAVPKPPLPTHLKRILGCSWSAFRGKARKHMEEREKAMAGENGTGSVDQSEQPTSKRIQKCSETSKRLDVGGPEVGVFADANKNYAKSINRILNGTKVSKKLILDETAESTSRSSRGKKIQAIGKTKKSGGPEKREEENGSENSSPEEGPPKGVGVDSSTVENIAERIKRRKLENSTTLSKNSSTSSQKRKENSQKIAGKRRKVTEDSDKVDSIENSPDQSPTRLRSDKNRDKKSKNLQNGALTGNSDFHEENKCDLDREIIEEQSRMERLISQEKKDFELAMRLQAQFDDMERIAGRTRGSKRAMALNHDNSNHFIDLKIDRLSRNTAKQRPDATQTRKQRRKPQKQAVK